MNRILMIDANLLGSLCEAASYAFPEAHESAKAADDEDTRAEWEARAERWAGATDAGRALAAAHAEPGGIGTASGKRAFIVSLAGSICADLFAAIDDGRIPDDWSGHELRALLAEKFAFEARSTLARGGALEPRSRRLREFRNHCAITQGL